MRRQRQASSGSWVATLQIDIGIPGADQRLIPKGRRFPRGQVFLLGLDQAALARKYSHRGNERSGTWILGHILVEESQHTGQVAMIRGMMRELGA